MIRTALTVAAAATLLAGAALAQTASKTAPHDPQSPDMQAYLQARGETYSRAPDSEQNPAEVATTAKLNASVVAHNDDAERSEQESQAAHDSAAARIDAEARDQEARYATARAEYEANVRAAEAARADYDRAQATWEGLIRACEASGRRDCRTPAPY